MKLNKDQLDEMLQFLESGIHQDAVAALSTHGTQVKAAKKLGITQGSLSGRLSNAVKKAQLRGWAPEFGSVHKIPAGMRVKGISSNVDELGNVKQSWVKLTEDRDAAMKVMLDNLESILEDYVPPKRKLIKVRKLVDKDTMTWYPIGDHHFGMYAWADETGVDYDTDIASDLLRAAIDKLVSSAPVSDQAALLNVGDFFHMDNTKNVTNHSGNVLDVDTRWTKVVQVGIDAMRYAVDRMLEKHRIVHVYNVVGNHDTHTAMALSMVMAAMFKHEPRVVVHVTANTFQYHEFGQCMIGMHHGDTIKKDDMYVGIMARDQAEMWGRTKFRYWWLGHIHNSQRREMPGVLIETFRTLAARDAWHASMGYGAGRDMTAIVLHKEFGEIERHTVPVEMIR